MLTFQFSGVDGTMTESETLTSGMVGKQIQLLFDDSWANLTKTVVFRAGDRNRVVTDASSMVVIPEAVLARPFGKLFVGVYGTDAAGTIVIPTIMAEGPMIRYGADPMEDETADDLPVWQNLQNQIGDLTALETENTENLVSAVNEIHSAEAELASAVHEIQEELSFIGEAEQLQTGDKSSLVAAVNEVHSQLLELSERGTGLTPAAAQLLVDILSKGMYASDQSENIDALAAELGATVPENLGNLTAYWDFRSGSLTDQIAGLEATSSEGLTLDTAGAHIDTNSDYLMFPIGTDSSTLAGHILEVKFGQMTLDESASTLRLVCLCTGNQPATNGLMWSVQDCWTSKATVVTEFTDQNIFSGRTLIGKGLPDINQIDWYLEDQLICSSAPTFTPTYISLGTVSNAAFPFTVEYVKIYPDA